MLGTARIAGHPGGQAHRRADPALPPAAAVVRRRRGSRSATTAVTLDAEARTSAQTGVEMEAMTAASVAALTVYDMVKGLERGVEIDRGRAAREDRRQQRLAARRDEGRASSRLDARCAARRGRGRRGPALAELLRGGRARGRRDEMVSDDREAIAARADAAGGPGGRALRLHHRRHRADARRRHARGHARRDRARGARARRGDARRLARATRRSGSSRAACPASAAAR